MNLFLIVVLAASLPSFEDFRRIDRMRRLTGQMLTDDLLRVQQMDVDLLVRTAQQHPEDPKLLWGAAELLVDWPQRRMMFERALAATGTNTAIAVRFACAAAKQGDGVAALTWLRECQKRDNDNTVPWLAELWLLREQKQPLVLTNSPPIWTTGFRDYSVEASRARIRLLEAAGYSPYSARRLGFSPDSPALIMMRDLCKPPVNEVTASLLNEASHAMQRRAQFLVSELVGQTIEQAILGQRPGASTSAEVRYRDVEMLKRREELTGLLKSVEQNIVDFATEAQMVQYFDDVLDKGEEAAMKRLADHVQQTGNTVTTTPAQQFTATRWTVVLTAGQGQSRALEELCRAYWFPLYAYIRRRGYEAHEAEDLTQEFFARLLAKNYLADVERERGKFRSFLLASLKHFLANEWDKARAQKRGGSHTHLSLDTAETRYRSEPTDELSADKLLERQWAIALLELVLSRLSAEYAVAEKAEVFEQLKTTLTVGSESIPYATIAGKLGTTEGAVKVAAHRLRRQYRKLLREEIAHTVAKPEEIDEEIRHLFAAFGR